VLAHGPMVPSDERMGSWGGWPVGLPHQRPAHLSPDSSVRSRQLEHDLLTRPLLAVLVSTARLLDAAWSLDPLRYRGLVIIADWRIMSA